MGTGTPVKHSEESFMKSGHKYNVPWDVFLEESGYTPWFHLVYALQEQKMERSAN